MNNVSVDEAIARGHRMVTYPVTAIFIVVMTVSFYLVFQEIVPVRVGGLGVAASLLLSWLYWSFIVTKWRLWAFENVRNVHELEKRAEQEKIIWSIKGVFEKTEIRSVAEQEKWTLLQEKFKQADVYYDDITVPYETLIYFSKGKKVFEIILGIVFLAIGLYITIINEEYFGLIAVIGGLLLLYTGIRDVTNNEPQIMIDHRGIKTAKTDFAEWKDIRSEEIVQERSGKSVQYYLVYSHLKGLEKVNIDSLDINQKTLNNLLRVYRVRSENRR